MDKSFFLYTDGGARGNPGPAAIGGIVLNDSRKVIKEFSRYIGEMTNNQAEYQALVFGLDQIKKIVGSKISHTDLRVLMDSELIVRQLKGEYRVKDIKLRPLYAKVQKTAQQFGRITFTHIRRERNSRADRLVNRALDSR